MIIIGVNLSLFAIYMERYAEKDVNYIALKLFVSFWNQVYYICLQISSKKGHS